ncbi:MAG: sensor histidine kinase [Kibdelosporangium sp.]
MRWIAALRRSLVLLALAIAGPLVFVYIMAGIALVIPIPWAITSARWLPRLARRLAGVPEEGVYWDPPAPPIPDEDGLYRVGDKLVRKPSWWHQFDRKLDWVTDDPGAHRDFNWLLSNVVVGGVLAGTAPGLIAFGGWLLFTSWWPAAPVLIAAGVWVAPWLVQVHDRWTSLMLKAKHDGFMYRFSKASRQRVEHIWHATALFLLALTSMLTTLVSLAVGTLMHWWGLWAFGWVPVVMTNRDLTGYRRQFIQEKTGITIPAPYLPQPAPPKPRPDGMYRHGRQLYKTPNAMIRVARYRWVMTDRATWRDFGSGFLDVLAGPFAIIATFFVGQRSLRLQGKVSRFLLAPTEAAVLAQRVQRLTETRADATDAQAAELRRIERDLHDGAQARLVALGLHLGAVERLIDQDPQAAKSLVARTKAASAEALVELRDLVRGIHPPVLAERGLVDAVRALALDSPLNVTVDGSLDHRPELPVESAAYFAVNELLVNAAKHARAEQVTVHIGQSEDGLRIAVTDDGRGGANVEAGGGLAGLRRRLATFDGTLDLDSPPGGPTVAVLQIPA